MWSKVGSAARPQSKERKMWAAHLRMRTPVAYPTVYSNTEGDYINSDSRGRARGEIGFTYGLNDNMRIDFESFYDGIGDSDGIW